MDFKMQLHEHHTSFSSLRASYLEVQSFLANEDFEKICGLDTDIEEGLQIAGDDTYKLIGKFITTYNLNTEGIDLYDYFLSEGEQFDETFAPLYLITFPIRIVLCLLFLLSFGRINYTNVQLVPEYGRKTKGMTLAELIIWHLTGKFTPRREIKILLNKIA